MKPKHAQLSLPAQLCRMIPAGLVYIPVQHSALHTPANRTLSKRLYIFLAFAHTLLPEKRHLIFESTQKGFLHSLKTLSQ